MPEPQMQK